MHLLPHKSWHVWKKDTVAKIEKDEKNHMEEMAQLNRKRISVESEARYERLAKKKRPNSEPLPETSPEQPNPPTETSEGHVNFFADIERTLSHQKVDSRGVSKNPEFEREKREQEKRLENRSTNYLGKGSIEDLKDKPWWWGGASAPKSQTPIEKAREEKSKRYEDPLMAMNSYLAQKKRATDMNSQNEKNLKRRTDSERKEQESSRKHKSKNKEKRSSDKKKSSKHKREKKHSDN